MAPIFHFEIVTLNGKPYFGNVKSLMVSGQKGYFGVLANHAAFISSCVPGRLKITEESGNDVFFRTGKGFFEVVKNRAILLVNSAEKTN